MSESFKKEALGSFSAKGAALLRLISEVKSEFQILASFLERCEPEVEGRSGDELSEEMKSKLERLAEGECSTPERLKLCEVLRENPAWITWVVERIKLKRVGPGERKHG